MTTDTLTTTPASTEEIQAQIAADLAAQIDSIETPTLTLGDLIRAGSAHTTQAREWGTGGEACALSAAALAADALGLL